MGKWCVSAPPDRPVENLRFVTKNIQILTQARRKLMKKVTINISVDNYLKLDLFW
jgi:hypothetical protein